MKINSQIKVFGMLLNHVTNINFKDKQMRKAVSDEYYRIMANAKDIGPNNTLLFSYTLAAYFIALVRNTNTEPEKLRDMLETYMRSSKLFKMLMGDAKGYFSEKKMQMRREWSKDTYKRKYTNDWIVDIIEKNDKYEFGLDYRECGACKLCKDEGRPELAKYLCSLDFAISEIIGVKLDRTKTLAEGDDCCDFRFRK